MVSKRSEKFLKHLNREKVISDKDAIAYFKDKSIAESVLDTLVKDGYVYWNKSYSRENGSIQSFEITEKGIAYIRDLKEKKIDRIISVIIGIFSGIIGSVLGSLVTLLISRK